MSSLPTLVHSRRHTSYKIYILLFPSYPTPNTINTDQTPSFFFLSRCVSFLLCIPQGVTQKLYILLLFLFFPTPTIISTDLTPSFPPFFDVFPSSSKSFKGTLILQTIYILFLFPSFPAPTTKSAQTETLFLFLFFLDILLCNCISFEESCILQTIYPSPFPFLSYHSYNHHLRPNTFFFLAFSMSFRPTLYPSRRHSSHKLYMLFLFPSFPTPTTISSNHTPFFFPFSMSFLPSVYPLRGNTSYKLYILLFPFFSTPTVISSD